MHGNPRLAEILQPRVRHDLSAKDLKDLENQLHQLIRDNAGALVSLTVKSPRTRLTNLKTKAHRFHMPPIAILTEVGQSKLWIPVPHMYGVSRTKFKSRHLTAADVSRVSMWNFLALRLKFAFIRRLPARLSLRLRMYDCSLKKDRRHSQCIEFNVVVLSDLLVMAKLGKLIGQFNAPVADWLKTAHALMPEARSHRRHFVGSLALFTCTYNPISLR